MRRKKTTKKFKPGLDGGLYGTGSYADLDMPKTHCITFDNPLKLDTGAKKNDQGKLRFDLIPASTEQALAKVLTHGARTYADENWRNGFNWKRVYAATRRHLNQWIDPRQPDTDEAEPNPSHLNHLYHAMCNIAFLIEFLESHPELDDRFKYE